MQTIEKNNLLSNAYKQVQDLDFQGVETFGLKAFELATTPAEVSSLLASGRNYVKYSPDSSITDHQGLEDGAVYALGSDGTPYKPLTEEVLLKVAIASAGGADLEKAPNVQQVIDYVLTQKVRALTKLGDGVLENAQYGLGYPTDLLPVDGQVDANTVYFAIADAGSVIGGETFDSVGFVYGIPSDSSHAGIVWRVIDPFDGLSSTGTITQGDSSLSTAAAVYAFVTNITDALSSSIAAADAKADQNVIDIAAADAKADQNATDIAGKVNSDGNVMITLTEGTNYTQSTGVVQILNSSYSSTISRVKQIQISDGGKFYPVSGMSVDGSQNFTIIFSKYVNMAGKMLLLQGPVV